MLVLISMMELLDNSESRGYRLELMHSSNHYIWQRGNLARRQ